MEEKDGKLSSWDASEIMCTDYLVNGETITGQYESLLLRLTEAKLMLSW